jgi:hypothetical protein
MASRAPVEVRGRRRPRQTPPSDAMTEQGEELFQAARAYFDTA